MAGPVPKGHRTRDKTAREWNTVQTLVHKAHAKGRTVLVPGDYNMSYNTEYHRHRTSSSQVQNTMLHSALDNAGLTDAWTQRHGHCTTYRTREELKEGESPVWTSPDHILISKNQAG